MLVILVSEIVTKKQSHFWQEFLYSVQNYEIIGIEKAKKPAIRVLCFLLTVVNGNETRSYETRSYENENENQNQNENETRSYETLRYENENENENENQNGNGNETLRYETRSYETRSYETWLVPLR